MFEDFLKHLADEGDLEEIPVGIDEFIKSETYLDRPEITLSEHQREAILHMTQIYKMETLMEFMHPLAAKERFEQTCNEVILRLGKGSGKDFLSTVACAYVVYLLLCLRDPAKYFGKPSGNNIDIINIAVNAQQAYNVFFRNASDLITKAPWFAGKYATKGGSEPAQKNQFNFDKNINLYSGHSEREAWEGYNVIMVILDEISAFGGDNPNNSGANTASATFKMYQASVSSRFAKFGKLALLSFPREKDDFISQRYNEVIAEKNIETYRHTFKLVEALPDGTEGNEFTIEWEEDHILRYKLDKVWALSRPTWKVNPTKTPDEFIRDFYSDPVDALTRFACMPPTAVDAFFKDHDKIDRAFRLPNGVGDDGLISPFMKPLDDTNYYIHVDLSKKIDRCAVALAHVTRWTQADFGRGLTEAQPHVKVDAIRYWTPTKDKNVDFEEVRDYIVGLAKSGFRIRLVTFDRWRSDDMITYLNNVGIKAEVLSVAKNHYIDFATVLMDDRLEGPDIEILREELKYLKVMPNDKIDHERSRTKDLSDATCGAIYNCVAHESGPDYGEIEVITATSFRRGPSPAPSQAETRKADAPMPSGLEEFLASMRKI